MATIPIFAIGKHWTVVTLTAQTPGSDGVLADNGTAKSIVALLRKSSMRQETKTSNLTAMGSRSENNVPYEDSTSWTFDYLLQYSDSVATPTNAMQALWQATDYVKLIVTRGGLTYTYFGLLTSHEENGSKEEATGSIGLQIADIGSFPGATNPNPATS